MTTGDGYFGKSGYTSIGDDFDKRAAAAGVATKDKKTLPGFNTAPGKKGAGPDTLFDRKVKSLAEGDKYVDPGVREKRISMENDKKKLTTSGFQYASKTVSKGPIKGMIGDYPKHEPEYVVVKRGEVQKGQSTAPRNIYTSPSKKGGYGTQGTTFGADQYKYVSDPYQQRQTEGKAGDDKKAMGAPFRSRVKASGGFNTTDATGTDKIYCLDVPLPPKKDHTLTKSGKEFNPGTSWKPSNPPKKGQNVFIAGKGPEYASEPLEHPVRRDKDNKNEHTWKPVSDSKSVHSRSVAFNPTAE
eukprot:245269_1